MSINVRTYSGTGFEITKKISCTNSCLFEADFCDFEHKLILINTQYGIMVFTAKGG